MHDTYCSMIHGGLHLDFKGADNLVQHCCLRSEQFTVDTGQNIWLDPRFDSLRQINKKNQWDLGCANCQMLEIAGQQSFRTGMNRGLSISPGTDLSGPVRLDLMFDNTCNLACRTCSPNVSTYWQRHLRDNGLWNQPISAPQRGDDIIKVLTNMDLSNLRQVVFCGGETLMGSSYWKVAQWLVQNVPNAKQNLMLAFQTNGTQSISESYYDIIESAALVKIHVSLDAVEERFHYLRWPASWSQVTHNIYQLRQSVPSNVMFLVEETVSIFNLFYLDELDTWISNNFSFNREGDIVDHTRHLALGEFGLKYLTTEYVDSLAWQRKLVPDDWQEDEIGIRKALALIRQFDSFRQQDFLSTFPALKEFYHRFL